MRTTNSFALLIFIAILGVGVALAYGMYVTSTSWESIWIVVGAFVVALVVASAIRVANQWDKAVVLRLGRFYALNGPGLFFIIPVIDVVAYWIDTRVITSSFKAEKTLTKDTVPVNVDAVLFWKVLDPKKAALDVADYQSAISWASQTALRDVIGKTMLSDMLEGRDKISDELQKIIDERTEPWGINVISVEVKDVLIPPALEDAMSMQAQAERERQARVILGDSERQVAENTMRFQPTMVPRPSAIATATLTQVGMNFVARRDILPSETDRMLALLRHRGVNDYHHSSLPPTSLSAWTSSSFSNGAASQTPAATKWCN